jgi:hypothetical protein
MTPRESAFIAEMQAVMEKYGVRVVNTGDRESDRYQFVGPDIVVNVEDLERER